jgi:putative phage-type endonuclease
VCKKAHKKENILTCQILLERVPHISTEKMSYVEWLEARRKGIGGSDAGPIMRLSEYGSGLTVYADKKSMGGIPAVEGPAARRGKILEPVVRKITEKDYPVMEIETVPYLFTSKENPFMIANIDGIIFFSLGKYATIAGKELSGIGGHEIKTSRTGYGFGDDEVPDSYYAQVQHYMAVLGLPWFLLSVYIMEKDDVRHYPIFRNEEFIKDMIIQEKEFWENFIITNTMPAPIGIEREEEMITSMFSGSETLVLDEAQRRFCAKYVELNRSIKEMEKEKEIIKISLMEDIVQRAKGTPKERKVSAIAGPYSVSWLTVERHDVDRDALKKAGLYDKYQKVSAYDRFTVTEKKGA